MTSTLPLEVPGSVASVLSVIPDSKHKLWNTGNNWEIHTPYVNDVTMLLHTYRWKVHVTGKEVKCFITTA